MATPDVEHGSSPGNHKVSGASKVATLLLFLGEGASADIFKKLSDDEVRRISQAITSLGVVDEETTKKIAEACHRELTGEAMQLRGDMEYVKRVIESAYNPETAREIIRYITRDVLPSSEGLKLLRDADSQQLTKLIEQEHPQTIAVLLAHLGAEQAAQVVAQLPDENRFEICIRLAQLDQISQPVRDKVTDIVAGKLREGGQYDQGSHGGLRRVAEIFNRMDRSVSRGTLETIETINPNLALSIRNLMFVFDDILLITDADMRKIIQKIDKKTLAKALKGTAEELREHFYRNMSQRAVEMLKEDMDSLGPIKLKDADAARQEIVTIIRQMEAEGLDLRGAGGDEYVV